MSDATPASAAPSEPGAPLVLMLSSAHPPTDVRIVGKEGATLAAAGWDVVHLCAAPANRATPVPSRFEGVTIRTYPRVNGLWARWRNRKRLAKLAEELLPDVIHAHEPDSWLAAIRVARKTGAFAVLDVHEHYPSRLDARVPRGFRWLARWAIRRACVWMARRADAVVVAKDGLADAFPGAQDIVPVRNYAAAVPLEPKVHEAGPLTLVHLGALTKERGAFEMLRALKLAPPGTRLWLIGRFTDGSEAAFKAEAARLGVADRIEHLGWMPHAEALAGAAQADIGLVLFQPGVENHRLALPHKLFDCMLAGIPVIVPAFAEEVAAVVREAACGVLVDSTDPRAIAAAVAALADPAMRAELGANGRQSALDRFGWAREAERLVKLYRELAPLPNQAPAKAASTFIRPRQADAPPRAVVPAPAPPVAAPAPAPVPAAARIQAPPSPVPAAPPAPAAQEVAGPDETVVVGRSPVPAAAGPAPTAAPPRARPPADADETMWAVRSPLAPEPSAPAPGAAAAPGPDKPVAPPVPTVAAGDQTVVAPVPRPPEPDFREALSPIPMATHPGAPPGLLAGLTAATAELAPVPAPAEAASPTLALLLGGSSPDLGVPAAPLPVTAAPSSWALLGGAPTSAEAIPAPVPLAVVPPAGPVPAPPPPTPPVTLAVTPPSPPEAAPVPALPITLAAALPLPREVPAPLPLTSTVPAAPPPPPEAAAAGPAPPPAPPVTLAVVPPPPPALPADAPRLLSDAALRAAPALPESIAAFFAREAPPPEPEDPNRKVPLKLLHAAARHVPYTPPAPDRAAEWSLLHAAEAPARPGPPA
ncbi:glycosyltransferase [Muricoccus radiodurans]|uniref:glycosyltransferase n=1 Tax=Muricoccus radiodurans TaxID=2231721 RepID=UPI003CF8A616